MGLAGGILLIGGAFPGEGWAQGVSGAVANRASIIQEKMARLQDGMQAQAKVDSPPIRVVMTMQRFEPLMKEGKLTDAEAVLDRALELLEKSQKGEDSLGKKLSQVQKGAEASVKAGRPPIRLAMAMSRFEPLMKEGNDVEAETLLDRALELLEKAKKGEDSLERKLGQVAKGMEELQKQGKDPSVIGLAISRFEPLLKEGKDTEAEKVLDRALKFLKSKDLKKESEAQGYVRVQEKMQEVQRRLPEWKKAGGKEEEIAPIGGPVGELIQSGKLEEAEQSLDKLLEILRK